MNNKRKICIQQLRESKSKKSRKEIGFLSFLLTSFQIVYFSNNSSDWETLCCLTLTKAIKENKTSYDQFETDEQFENFTILKTMSESCRVAYTSYIV